MKRSMIRTVLATGVGVALLAACGGPGGTPSDTGTSASPTADETTVEPSQEPTPSASEGTPADEVTDAPQFPADTAADTQEPSGESDLMLTDVRAAEHDGFDRVVLEFAGTGGPGWRTEYVAEAVQDGSGEPIDVEGDAVLQVNVSGTRYPAENEAGYYDGPRSFSPEDEEVDEVYVGGTFEGLTQVVLGIDSADAPFRVFPLQDPVRVVIDVQHVED